jgi:serine/threonine protein kinase
MQGLFARLRDGDLEPGTLVGDFRIERKLGEGGMAQVFAAVHPVVGKRAAIKVISKRLCADQHAVERFVQEARAVHQIGHPNIVDTFGFGTLPDGRCYMLLEWLDGESLGDRLARGPLPLGDALEIVTQLAEALEAAHAKGIIHRDLKPDNVIVDSSRGRPSVKLVDFGIAKLAQADVTLPRTRSGAAMGTPGYMSPEQARGKSVDGRTDVYALGAMTFQMVLGRLPFEGESAIDILAKHLAEAPPAPSSLWSGIPPALDRLILRMMEKSAADRPDLAEVLKVLANLRGQPLPERRLGTSKRVSLWVAGAALTAVGATTLLLFLHRVSTRGPDQPPVTRQVVATAPAAAAPAADPPKAPEPGALWVQPDAPGAQVRVDGAPLGSDGLIRFDKPGVHQVTVTAPRHRTASQSIEVPTGKTVELRVHLEAVRAKSATPRSQSSGDYTLDPFAP